MDGAFAVSCYGALGLSHRLSVQGKQLFSVLVRPNVQCGVFVNLELEEKAYTRQGREFCLNDGCVSTRASFARCARALTSGARSAVLCASATASFSLGAWAR